MADNSKITAKKRGIGRPFRPGESGNPGGRPKQTQEQKDALQEIRAAAPKAVSVMLSILDDESANNSLRFEVAKCILERVYGKPKQEIESSVTVDPVRIIDDIPREASGDA